MRESSLKKILDRFYREYDFEKRLEHDPIQFPRRFSEAGDIEIAGFIASCFAYGRVELFRPVIERVLRPMGKHPAQFLKKFNLKKDSRHFKGIRYRFNNEEDVICLIYMLSQTLKTRGSLKDLFYSCFRQESADIEEALGGFTGFFLRIETSPVYGKNIKPRGLTQFFPVPAKGGACKRMNLFLRWMVRTRDIDLGVWNNIPSSRLIIPLDTHIAKISRCLGLTSRATTGWRTAKEITESLKKIDPDDPLKYDFALCHHGISGMCKGGKYRNICESCAINHP